MEWISDPQAWVGFATLTVLEIVLGIDNVIFISILASKLPRDQQSTPEHFLQPLGHATLVQPRSDLLCERGDPSPKLIV